VKPRKHLAATSSAPGAHRAGRREPAEIMDTRQANSSPVPEAGHAKNGEMPKLQRHEAAAIFEALNNSGNGDITHAEFVRGLRDNPVLAEVLNVPTRTMQVCMLRPRISAETPALNP